MKTFYNILFVLGLLCLIGFNFMLILWLAPRGPTKRCVSSPACICRADGSLCWDQHP